MAYIGNGTDTFVRNDYQFVATASQTTFSCNYTVGYVDVFWNGFKLDSAEYVANNGTSIVLNTSAVAGDKIQILAYNAFNIANIDSASSLFTPAGGLSSTNVQQAIVELDTEKAPLASPALTGNLTLNNINLSAYYGKNYIINGGFDYWNYATSQTTNSYGSDDRWYNASGGSTKSHFQQPAGDLARAFFNASKISETVVTSVAGAGNYVNKTQRIENITKLAGKTVTLSFWAKADTSKNIAIDFVQNFGTGGTPSAVVAAIGAQLIALTSTWQKKSITVTLPSIIGKTLGSDGVHTSYTALRFWFDAGSTYISESANLGQQSGTFDIAEVKLEEGSVATPWTPYEGEFGGEVQACQRYYEIVPFTNWAYSAGVTTGAAGALVKFTAIKRVAPTAGTITVASSTGTNTYSIDSIGTSVARFVYNSTQSGIVGATGSVPFSAEL